MINKKIPKILNKPKLILNPIILTLNYTFLIFLQKNIKQTLLILIILITIIFYSKIKINKILKFNIPTILKFLIIFIITLITN